MDVWNSRGKFDEIKEEFVINPAPIASQSSLNARGSRRTKDLPRNLLNSLHESIKSWRTRRENTLPLKGNFARKSWPIDAVVGAD